MTYDKVGPYQLWMEWWGRFRAENKWLTNWNYLTTKWSYGPLLIIGTWDPHLVSG